MKTKQRRNIICVINKKPDFHKHYVHGPKRYNMIPFELYIKGQQPLVLGSQKCQTQMI